MDIQNASPFSPLCSCIKLKGINIYFITKHQKHLLYYFIVLHVVSILTGSFYAFYCCHCIKNTYRLILYIACIFPHQILQLFLHYATTPYLSKIKYLPHLFLCLYHNNCRQNVLNPCFFVNMQWQQANTALVHGCPYQKATAGKSRAPQKFYQSQYTKTRSTISPPLQMETTPSRAASGRACGKDGVEERSSCRNM